MSIERDDIITTLVSRITNHADDPMVSRDWKKRATLEHFPTVFVVPRQDDIIKTIGLKPHRCIRNWHISVVSFVEGADGETAPDHLESFQDEVRRVIYEDEHRRIGSYGAGIREVATSQVVFPPIGNNVVAQEIIFLVDYVEDTGKLTTPVSPTD